MRIWLGFYFDGLFVTFPRNITPSKTSLKSKYNLKNIFKHGFIRKLCLKINGKRVTKLYKSGKGYEKISKELQCSKL